MKIKAIRNFLHNGEHVEAGATVEVGDAGGRHLIALHRAVAVEAESDAPAAKPKRKAK